MKTLVASVCLLLATTALSIAEEGQPVAVRHWPGGGFTVETMWNLHVGMGLNDEAKKSLPGKLDFDDSLDGNKDQLAMVHVVGRKQNESDSKIMEGSKTEPDKNSVRIVTSMATGGGTMVVADGVTIFNVNGIKADAFPEFLKAFEKNMTDLLEEHGGAENWHCCLIATDPAIEPSMLEKLAALAKPEIMVVASEHEKVNGSDTTKQTHNTIAISASAKRKDETRFVTLGTEPYKMTDEVADLFEKKEASQRASAEFFAALSIEQMNFKPSNGTHTPRWNTEHMMGRELQFFSQIYNAVDPSVPVMNIHPKQMPKDYQFAHPDWTGEEEARQTLRVLGFTRRFAYLLDGLNLDKRAPGSRFWTPRALLKQMERHYNEHTGNVKKKMELPEWPKSK